MFLTRKAWLAALLVCLFIGWILAARPALAEDNPPPDPPARIAQISVQVTRHYWWLVRYKDNTIVCELPVEHEGIPTYNEIEGLCGKPIATEWLKSLPCATGDASTAQCPGLYALSLGSQDFQRVIEVELPIPKVWIEVVDCNPVEGRCTTLPALRLTGEEPLPNEAIISIQGALNGEPFQCAGNECRLPLPPTNSDGVDMEFWGDSSFGDSSEHYTAKVRLVPWGDFMNPEAPSTQPGSWYVDVLSSQWVGADIASCADTWQAFPELGGLAEWLRSPTDPAELQSDVGYYYLAGALIQNGVVDASTCLDGGLQGVNVASACGVEAAGPALLEWQNRFDQEIWQASQNTGLPAQLLKNVFARESQIWPGIFRTYREAGLGQLTENGADTVLLWNPDFFHQFCPLVLNQAYCDLGWGNLGATEQGILRGALVNKVNAACPDCPTGIDISQANYSVEVFAHSLLANCEQTGRILRNVTNLDPGQTTSYTDLWRLTLVNYNAGPGCLSNAVRAVQSAGLAFTWDNISARLEPACQGAIGYVEDISRSLKATPTPTPWLPLVTPVTPVPQEPALPTPQEPQQPTPTPTQPASIQPTPTQQSTGYPEPSQPTPTGDFGYP